MAQESMTDLGMRSALARIYIERDFFQGNDIRAEKAAADDEATLLDALLDADRAEVLAWFAVRQPSEGAQAMTDLDRLDALAAVRARDAEFGAKTFPPPVPSTLQCAADRRLLLAEYDSLVAENKALREAGRAVLDYDPRERWSGAHDWLAELVGYYEDGGALASQRPDNRGRSERATERPAALHHKDGASDV